MIFHCFFPERGSISSDVIEFALQHVEMILIEHRHEDIDAINNSHFHECVQERQHSNVVSSKVEQSRDKAQNSSGTRETFH